MSMIVAGIVILIAVCGPASGIAGPDNDEQRIFLDPETGEVIAPPEAERAQKKQAAPERRATEAHGNRAWRTDDGVEMLSPDPDDAPMAKAVQCADGSLRIGHTQTRKDGQTGREALCDRPPQ